MEEHRIWIERKLTIGRDLNLYTLKRSTNTYIDMVPVKSDGIGGMLWLPWSWSG